MQNPKRLYVLLAVPMIVALSVAAVWADNFHTTRLFTAGLSGFEEVPALVSPGSGAFKATLDFGSHNIYWELQYRYLDNEVTQVHIHVGQRGVNGGAAALLCSNLSSAPVGTQPCPTSPTTLNGMLTAADVLDSAAGQGIAAGDIESLMLAIRAGTTYVNVHTMEQPAGEIRGQISTRYRAPSVLRRTVLR